MEDEEKAFEQRQVFRTAQEKGLNNAGNGPAAVRHFLSDSIYLWGCGERAANEEHDPTLSDRAIGWLILLVQGFSYGMLIVLARAAPSSGAGVTGDDDGSQTEEYVLASVTGAMYLLIASTTHDLRAGYSLFVDGPDAHHRAFGIGILTVFVVMISSAMNVLVSTSSDSASIMLNAVAVLFIADLDEKALKFFSTIPQKWRLFWAIECFGISFSLALVAIYSIGDSFALLKTDGLVIDGDHIERFPTWMIWVLNPAVVTMCSYFLSVALRCLFESCSVLLNNAEPLTLYSVVTRAYAGVVRSLKRGKSKLKREPCFYAALGVWFVQGPYIWWPSFSSFKSPLAFDCFVLSRATFSVCLSAIANTLGFANAMLGAGIVMKVLSACLPNHERIAPRQESGRLSGSNGPRTTLYRWVKDSRLPSLLIGWGLGYWVTSLLFLFGGSWFGGGWDTAPMAVSILGYVVLPCFAIVSIFMMAESTLLGEKVGAFIKPAVEILIDRQGTTYWVMVSVFRDAFLLWMIGIVFVVLQF